MVVIFITSAASVSSTFHWERGMSGEKGNIVVLGEVEGCKVAPI